MPSTPVKRPMSTPLQTMDSSANQAPHQKPFFQRRFFANDIAAGDELFRFAEFSVLVEMNGGQGLSLFHAIAYAFVEFEADAVINFVFLLFAAASQHGERNAELLTVHAGDEAAGPTRHMK